MINQHGENRSINWADLTYQVFVGAVLSENKFSRTIIAACAIDTPHGIQTHHTRLPMRLDSTVDSEQRAVTEWLTRKLPEGQNVDIFYTGTFSRSLVESEQQRYKSLTVQLVDGEDNLAYKLAREVNRAHGSY